MKTVKSTLWAALVLALMSLTHVPAAALPSVLSDSLSEQSLYRFDAVWTNQDGQDIRLVDLRGQPLLVAMIYTDCHAACPVIVHNMKRIGKHVTDLGGPDLGYLLVSINPEHDMPEMLRQFSEMHRLSAPDWTLLQGPDTDVRTLATLLGVRYKREANGQYSHSNVITLLSTNGEILYQQDRLDVAPAITAEAIRTRLADG